MSTTAKPTLQVILSMLDNVSAPLRATADTVGSIADGMKTALEGIGVALTTAALADFFKGTVDAAEQAETALNTLKIAVNDSGQSFVTMQPQIMGVIDGLTKTTTYSRTDYITAFGNMISMNHNVSGSMQEMGLGAYVAAMFLMSLGDAADLVGRIMVGSVKSLQQYGVTATDTDGRIAQLTEITNGYATGALDTLAGKVAQTKSNFDEFKVSIGDIILNSDGARDAAGFFATALGDLATWVNSNKGALEQFVGQIFSTGSSVLSLLKPVGDLIVAIYNGVNATIGWKNLWNDFRLGLVVVAAAFGELAAGVEYAVGFLLVQFGQLVAQSAPLFNLLGIHATAWSQGVIKSGQSMVDQATVSFQTIADKSLNSAKQILAGTDASQAAQTQSVKDGTISRQQMIDAATAAEVKAEAAATKQIQTEMESLTKAQQAVTDQFTKDFAANMPAAAAALQIEINKLSAQVVDWQGKEATAQTLALAAYKANHQELGDMYSAEADGIATTLAGWQQKLAVYLAVQPIYAQLSDLSKAVVQAESDPNPHMQLTELNADLQTAVGLRAWTFTNSQAQKDLDTQIAAIQKDITTATQATAIAGADLSGPLQDQTRLEKNLSDMAADRLSKTQAISDAEMQAAKTAIGLASSTGAIDSNLAGTLTSAIGIGQSLAGGDYAGAIAGFGSLLNSVFSDAKSAAIRALMEKNNEQLAALTAIQGKLVDQTDTGAKLQRVLNALDAVGPNEFIPGGGMAINSGDVADALMNSGGSFQDVVDVAKDLGIDLGTTNQQTSIALVQLQQALQTFKPQAFGSDYQGQLSQAGFTEGLTGGSGPSLSDYASALGSSAGSSYLANALFQGLDPNNMSAADWQTLQARVSQLGGSVNGLTTTQMGGLSLGDITSTLTAIAGLAPTGSAATTTTAPAAATTTTAPAAAPTTTFTAPSSGAVLVQDAQGWSFTDLGNFLGPKIDLTNAKLDTVISTLQDMGDTLDTIATADEATAGAMTDGSFAATIGATIQADTDRANANLGVGA